MRQDAYSKSQAAIPAAPTKGRAVIFGAAPADGEPVALAAAEEAAERALLAAEPAAPEAEATIDEMAELTEDARLESALSTAPVGVALLLVTLPEAEARAEVRGAIAPVETAEATEEADAAIFWQKLTPKD